MASKIGEVVIEVEFVESTNTFARFLAKRGSDEGTCVLAQTQSGGRGRLDRSWISPLGGIYLSIIFRPTIPIGDLPALPLLVATSTAISLSASTDCAIKVRWPNDLLIDGKKVGGVLAESSVTGDKIEYAIIGIGINPNRYALHHRRGRDHPHLTRPPVFHWI